MSGTPRALLPVTERVLGWVAEQRSYLPAVDRLSDEGQRVSEDLRAIELCALATREASMFFDLYGGDPRAAAAEVQEQRSPAEGLPGSEGREGRRCGCSDRCRA